MTDENLKKLIKHFSNGVTHNLILWIISKEKIHGYGIMKIIDEFFSFENEWGSKASSSKIYPILSKMEEDGLIKGEWDINENNKRVKFYSITSHGREILNLIQNHLKYVISNPKWVEFLNDMTGGEFCERN